jgi:hypothetical protein
MSGARKPKGKAVTKRKKLSIKKETLKDLSGRKGVKGGAGAAQTLGCVAGKTWQPSAACLTPTAPQLGDPGIAKR